MWRVNCLFHAECFDGACATSEDSQLLFPSAFGYLASVAATRVCGSRPCPTTPFCAHVPQLRFDWRRVFQHCLCQVRLRLRLYLLCDVCALHAFIFLRNLHVELIAHGFALRFCYSYSTVGGGKSNSAKTSRHASVGSWEGPVTCMCAHDVAQWSHLHISVWWLVRGLVAQRFDTAAKSGTRTTSAFQEDGLFGYHVLAW